MAGITIGTRFHISEMDSSIVSSSATVGFGRRRLAAPCMETFNRPVWCGLDLVVMVVMVVLCFFAGTIRHLHRAPERLRFLVGGGTRR